MKTQEKYMWATLFAWELALTFAIFAHISFMAPHQALATFIATTSCLGVIGLVLIGRLIYLAGQNSRWNS